MGSEPFPKFVENRDGDRILVQSVQEQDAATKKGYLRSTARKRELAEKQANA